MLRRLIPDSFILVLMATVLAASIMPVHGAGAKIAGHVLSVAIFLLFFLHGLRLPRAEVISAMRNWRLQALIMAFVFGVMTLIGLSVSTLGQGHIPAGLVTGIAFLGFLPSTVQSAISYSAIAGGNVAASVMASALTNLSGIIITPLCVALLLHSGGSGGLGSEVVIKIISILLLPFALGQFMQRWWSPWVERHRAHISKADKAAIATAVYIAFSSAVAAGLWQQVDAAIMIHLTGLVMLMLALAFGGTWLMGKALKLPRADRISLIFSGAHKSIATGAPLAAILFTGPQAGMVILPALIYHLLQLMISAPLANRFASQEA